MLSQRGRKREKSGEKMNETGKMCFSTDMLKPNRNRIVDFGQFIE